MKKVYFGIIFFLLIGLILSCSNNKKLNEITDTSLKKNNNFDKSTDNQTLFLNNLTMINETKGWVLKGNRVLRTDDGGKTWDDVSPYSSDVNESYADEPHTAVCFYDNNTAWITLGAFSQVKQLVLYRTINGGNKWDKILLPITEDWESTGSQYIDFIDSLNGFILINSEPALGQMNKTLYKTTDGGKSWSRIGNITDKIGGYTTGIKFSSSMEGWITSSNHGQNYILTFRTNDGGYSWHKEDLQMPPNYEGYYTNSYSPVFLNKEKKVGVLPIEFINGDSRFIIPYLTNNGGNSWHETKILSNHSFSCFDFIKEKQWLAIDTKENELYETNTGGETWVEVSQNEMFNGIKTLDFVTTQIGFAIGDNIFIKTIDGGKTWSEQNLKVILGK